MGKNSDQNPLVSTGWLGIIIIDKRINCVYICVCACVCVNVAAHACLYACSATLKASVWMPP